MSAVQRVREASKFLRGFDHFAEDDRHAKRARALDLAADVCEAGIQWRDLIRTGAMLDEVETGLLAALDRLAAGEEVAG